MKKSKTLKKKAWSASSSLHQSSFTVTKAAGLKAMKCIAMELTEPDAKGRRGVKEVPGSEFTMDVDTVIIAIGQTPNPIIQRTTDGLQSDPRHGTICVNEVGKTSLDGVYAGGDVATGAATVISAMGAGKRAAKAMHEYLTNKK